MVRLQRLSDANEDIFSLEFKEKEKEQSKVCFLSGMERVLLGGGHSRLDCDYSREITPVGPGSYNIAQSTLRTTPARVISTSGISGASRNKPRQLTRLSPGSYVRTHTLTFHKKCKGRTSTKPKVTSRAPPFNSAVPRFSGGGVGGPKADTPGFKYDVDKAWRGHEMPFDHTFGGRTRLRPHVMVKCTPDNLDLCARCDTRPIGDYWYNGPDCLCRPCFSAEYNSPMKYARRQLHSFKRIRDCSAIHQHEGTTAAVPLQSDKDIRKQRVLECYFACFEGSHKIIAKPREPTVSRCQEKTPKAENTAIQVLYRQKGNIDIDN